MLEMIRAELLKASRKKRTWVLLAIFAVLVPAAQLVSAYFITSRVAGSFLDQGGVVSQAAAQIASPFALARNNLGAVVQALLLVIAAVVSTFLVGEERGFKMWKVILTAGPSRPRVLLAKFAAGMALMGLFLFGGLAGAIVFGTIGMVLGLPGGFGGDWGALLALYGLQWLVMAAPLALGFLVSWLVASPALAVIGVVVLPGLFEGLVTILAASQFNRISLLSAPFEAARAQQLAESLPRYFFTPNVNLGSRFLGGQARDGLGLGESFSFLPAFEWSEVGRSVVVAAVYFAVFAALLAWSFNRRDVHD